MFSFDFERYPYIAPGSEGLAGQIRTHPEDFQVYEVPAYAPSGEGEHLLFLLQKRNLTTRAVFEFIRDHLHISEPSIGVAGLKDKKALTQQWFSIPARHAERLGGFEALEGVQVLEQALHPHKLRIGHLKGNQFKILVRHTQPGGLELTQQILHTLTQQGVPNYYGPQRFGLGGQNAVKGHELATKGKLHAPSWLKKFLMSSLQSFLFNEWLSLRIREGTFGQVIEGDVAKKHDTGGEFVVEDAAAENPRALRFEISATGALYGKKYREAKAAARALEDQVLAQFNLTREHFRARRGDRRALRFPLEGASVETVPEGLWLNFFLPKGAYATAVLREVMKRNPEAEHELETETSEESSGE